MLRRFFVAEAHHHLMTALAVGIGTFAGTFVYFKPAICLSISWDAFALTRLLLSFVFNTVIVAFSINLATTLL